MASFFPAFGISPKHWLCEECLRSIARNLPSLMVKLTSIRGNSKCVTFILSYTTTRPMDAEFQSRQLPHFTEHPPGSEQLQASDDLILPNPPLHSEIQHSGPADGSSSNYNAGSYSVQNNNTSEGNQFPFATFKGTTNFCKEYKYSQYL